ncbi:hypothetical protein PRIPAC_91004 [Pristionchus pacificus]|uniref:Uncharacterized protein n=1 Tax=Pristionchus pacificus TaxID=54126 RepID=A0A2A6B8V4_PRIPA|nr:hypothetical protein PRIPAC_91004 [Pristionchus pacificus]|eukprot:PDM62312.1 hypothetical protein PRIPAC_51754 [Pristionchus pacificus]
MCNLHRRPPHPPPFEQICASISCSSIARTFPRCSATWASDSDAQTAFHHSSSLYIFHFFILLLDQLFSKVARYGWTGLKIRRCAWFLLGYGTAAAMYRTVFASMHANASTTSSDMSIMNRSSTPPTLACFAAVVPAALPGSVAAPTCGSALLDRNGRISLDFAETEAMGLVDLASALVRGLPLGLAARACLVGQNAKNELNPIRDCCKQVCKSKHTTGYDNNKTKYPCNQKAMKTKFRIIPFIIMIITNHHRRHCCSGLEERRREPAHLNGLWPPPPAQHQVRRYVRFAEVNDLATHFLMSLACPHATLFSGGAGPSISSISVKERDVSFKGRAVPVEGQ